MRCFVAVALPDAVRSLLVQVQEALRRAEADVKWVEAGNLHLSLKFLGELHEDQVSRLQGLLSVEALRWRRIQLHYRGVGVFPSGGTPRVLWAGCAGDVDTLAGLAGSIERCAEQVGVPREPHPFVAHLTLGRVKSDRNVKRLKGLIEAQREAAFGSDGVSEFVLYRSTLTPSGPIYEPLSTFPLPSAP